MPCFYLTPKQDDFNQELQVCIVEALYDVDSIVAEPGAYTKEQLATLYSQIVSNLERAWEIAGGIEDQLNGTMLQINPDGNRLLCCAASAVRHRSLCRYPHRQGRQDYGWRYPLRPRRQL